MLAMASISALIVVIESCPAVAVNFRGITATLLTLAVSAFVNHLVWG